MNWIIRRIMKMIDPMMRSPPPTKLPNVATTFQAYPSRSISLVDEVFIAILNSVVNKRSVGKKLISRTSLQKRAPNIMVIASEILKASNISSITAGIGIMKRTMAIARYIATNTSNLPIDLNMPSSFP